MNPAFQEHLVSRGARIDGGRVADFGAPDAERENAASGTVLVPLSHLSVVRAGGPDAATFLHNLVTNDVKGLASGQAQYDGLCTPKGRMLASFLLWREADGLLLATARDLKDALLRRLAMYVLRSKVSLSDVDAQWVLLGLAGLDAEAAAARCGLPAPREPMGVAAFADGMVIRVGDARFQIAVRAPAAAALWDALCGVARPGGEALWRWFDIRAGIPLVVAATSEEFVPQMVNFELVGGVNFHKGCYPGQEVVARSQYLGKIKRRMVLAHLDAAAAPTPGEHLYGVKLGDQSCGAVVDAVPAPGGDCDLLAVVQTSSAESGAIRLGRPDGPELRLQPLPYPVS
ncbi:MAG: folate-binding protein [Rhodocyclales bacterium CG17_big_fil_post_rev_8_21_14_2_50_68_7]|nr:MAG: folate-binding protein [Rhodocyclales bacterium CG17_big_fil_post_rev_8_21_14_2_50_68_7]